LSEINDYVFNGEGSEPSIDNSEAGITTQSVEDYVFGDEAKADSKLVIPAPGTTNIGKALFASGAYLCEWRDITATTIDWGNINGTLADQADLQAALDAKVNTVAGYGLSQNNLSDALKSTYDGYASGKEDAGVAAGLLSSHNSTYTHTDIALNTTDRHSHSNKATLDLIDEAFTSSLKSTYDGYASSISGKEPALGNPSISGYVLSSTDAGVRSWVEMTSGVTDHDALNNLDYASAGHTGFEPTVTKGNLTEATSSVLTISSGTNAVIGSGTTIQVKEASAVQSGYLSLTDWSTFNGKQDALGYTPVPNSRTINGNALTSNITLDTSDIAATTDKNYVTDAQLTVIGNTSGTNTGDEDQASIKTKLGAAATGVDGYLTGTDWDTFNSKQAGNANLTSLSSLSYVSTSFVKMTGANTFALDTNTYEPTLSKGNLTETTSNILTITGGTNAIIGSGVSIEVQQADTENDGYLSSTDWDTFNGKQDALTFGIADNNAVEIDSSTVASGEYAKFTANGLESKSFSEVQEDLDILTKTVEINAQTGTSYSLQASDNGKLVTLNNASAITLTVPSGLGAGFNCQILQIGAGQVTVSESGTTVNNRESHTKLSGQYASASLVAYAANTFLFQGDTTT
jgi:hypothetical protein